MNNTKKDKVIYTAEEKAKTKKPTLPLVNISHSNLFKFEI